MSLTIPSPVDIDGNRDQFWCFVLDTKLDQDRWFDSMQINAGNAKIVHHVLVYDDVNGALHAKRAAAGKYECFGGVGVSGASLINAGAPGGVPFQTPPDVAFQIKKNARLILQVHYHPTGTKETDSQTGVDLKFAAGTPKYKTAVSLIGNFVSPNLLGGLLPGPDDPPNTVEFKIPAGAKRHTETMTYTVTVADDQLVWSMGTHMHYVGRGSERAPPARRTGRRRAQAGVSHRDAAVKLQLAARLRVRRPLRAGPRRAQRRSVPATVPLRQQHRQPVRRDRPGAAGTERPA